MKRLFNIIVMLFCGFYLSACAVTNNFQAPVEDRAIAQNQSSTQQYPDSDKIDQIAASYNSQSKPFKFDQFKDVPEINPPSPGNSEPLPNEVKCMALAMYHEARGEGEKGMTAVGYVIMNRTNDDRFPNTICGVTHDGKKFKGKLLPNQCQFSYMCDGKTDKPKNQELFEEITQLAKQVIKGEIFNPIGKSLYFHSKFVKVNWGRRYAYIKKIGNHIFYA